MNMGWSLFGELETPNLGDFVHDFSSSATWQGFLFFGVLGLVALVAFAWAAFFRKPNRRRRVRHRRYPAPLPAQAETPPREHRHHRRRRRRERRPRNPTLAETSGSPAPAREPAAALSPDPCKKAER